MTRNAENLRLELVPLDDLKIWAANPKTHSLPELKESLRRYGFVDPPKIDSTLDALVYGNGRVEALRAMRDAGESPPRGIEVAEDGAWLVPVQFGVDQESEEVARALALDHNSLTAAGLPPDQVALMFDAEILAELMGGENPPELVLDFGELQARAGDGGGDLEEDEVPEPPSEPVTKKGDLWVLGDHRLLCGDSRRKNSWAAVAAGARADLVITDPPYGVNIQERDMAQAEVRGRRKDGLGVANDDLSGAELAAFLREAFSRMAEVTKLGASWYVFAPSGVDYRHPLNALAELGAARHGLVWVKDRFVMGRCDYHYRHENIIFGWTPGGAHQRLKERNQDSVWEHARPGASPEHPTMKPVAMLCRAIENSSVGGQVVIDGFAGSGSTLVAAETSQRRCVTIELDPAYCDVVVERWEGLTGGKATRDVG